MSKKDDLRAALLRGERLTPLLALQRYRCLSLSQRIGEFKTEGMRIEDMFVEGQPYKIYWIAPQPEQLPLSLAA